MSDVQCKKNRNEVIPVSEAVANHLEDHNTCISCQDYDKCREEKEESEIEGGIIKPCCANCKYFGYAAPSSDQPYAEFWCKKEKWDGMDSQQALYEEIICEFFEKV
jgi:hypothetical protein